MDNIIPVRNHSTDCRKPFVPGYRVTATSVFPATKCGSPEAGAGKGPVQNLFFRISEPRAPRIETAVARIKAFVNVPDASFIQPPMAGPRA